MTSSPLVSLELPSGTGLSPSATGRSLPGANAADVAQPTDGTDFAGLLTLLGGLPPAGSGVVPKLAPWQFGVTGDSPLPAGKRPPGVGAGFAGVGTPLPAAGNELPQDARELLADVREATASLARRDAIVGSQATGQVMLPSAVELRAVLRDGREALADPGPAEPGLLESIDDAALLDVRPAGNSPASTGTRAVAPAPLPASPAEQPGFDQAVGQRLLVMVQSGRQDATLKVYPEHLGSVDIQIQLDGDEARLSLASPHSSVRDALELAIPRLREMLTGAGVSLAHVDVGAGDSQSTEHPDGEPRFSGADSDSADVDSIESSVPLAARLRVVTGLVDTFA